MFFESPRFPEAISRGAKGGPGFSTEVVALNSGRKQKNINWPDPVRKYDVSHGIRTQQEFDELLAFFLVIKGMGHEFRYKDWSDYRVTNGPIAASQLLKRYFSGPLSYDRVIAKPVPGTARLYLDGEALPDSGYSIDAATGRIGWTMPEPEGVLSWSGEFDVPCAFSTDLMQAVIESSGIYSWEEILVEEVRP
ncbi:MAG: DUF2460 domain-containing protein [Burkholderiales bacterium]